MLICDWYAEYILSQLSDHLALLYTAWLRCMLAQPQITCPTGPESNQDRLKRFILERGYTSKENLPPEPALARELGISRASLREAISALQSQGIVESHQGRGTFVSSFSFTSVVSSLGFHIQLETQAHPAAHSGSLTQLVQMGELIESALISELIDQYRQADILALYALTTKMQQAAERGEEFMELDWRFHNVLHRRSGNEMLLNLLDAFWEICNQARLPVPPREYLVQNAENHRKIVDAIAQRDARAASNAMRVHFNALRSFT